MKPGIHFKLLVVAALTCWGAAGAFAQSYDDYAQWCRDNGGDPSPSPARCDFPDPAPSQSSSPSAEDAARAEREARDAQEASARAAFLHDRDSTDLKGADDASPGDAPLKDAADANKNVSKTAPPKTPSPTKVPVAASGPLAKAPITDRAYAKGQKDGSDCLPQHASTVCVGLSAAEMKPCVDQYHSGFQVGSSSANAFLQAVYNEGRALKAEGKPFAAYAHTVAGKCGVHAAKSYASGYRGAPYTPIGK